MANGIPVFTPSGQGLMVDLKNIKVSEAISWGAYKGKLKKKYKEVAGTEIVNIDGTDHEVFNDIVINQYAGLPDSETYKLIEMFGVDEEGFAELAAAWNDNDLEKFNISWNATQSTLVENYEQWIDAISDFLVNATEIRLTSTPIHYDEATYSPAQRVPIYTQDWGISSTSSSTTLNLNQLGLVDYDTTATLIKARSDRLTNVYTVTIYNGITNITADFTPEYLKMIASLVLMEGDNAFVKTSESYTTTSVGGFTLIHQTEKFNPLANESFLKTKYVQYSEDDPDEEDEKFRIVKGYGFDAIYSGEEYFNFYWANIWSARDTYGAKTIEVQSKGLFVQQEGRYDWSSKNYSGGINRMTYDGLRRATMRNFGYFVSEFMYINSKVDEGNWLDKIVTGIMKFLGTLVEAFLNLAEVLPIVGDLIQILIVYGAKLFGMTYEQFRAALKSVIMAVVIAIIAYYAPMMVGELAGSAGGIASNLMVGLAGGAMTIPQMLSVAMEIYSIANNALLAASQQKEREEQEKKAQEEKNLDVDSAKKEAFSGTMGTRQEYEDSNDLMYNKMFNPLDSLVFGEMPIVANDINK